ncbi:(2Fe-2S)-binding protein [Meridianimarinicoccus sp. RP-17]|uniref:(2Fe-2S)-binding protein n=1 Tax=Meridianimarinicoccus zhengii TaxID=2056810 RepID=UPI000DAD9BC0|nr:(2Fe-2S)-binding protein [Phycocomes zhengii]
MPETTPPNKDLSSGTITVRVNGRSLPCLPGQTVAGALLMAGFYQMRRSPNADAPRGAFCMVGACQECAIMIDGTIRRACQTEVHDGMEIRLEGAGMGGVAENSSTTATDAGGKTVESGIS